MIRSGWCGIRFTQNDSGGSASQVKNALEDCRAVASPASWSDAPAVGLPANA
jgi:hypothetical protein